MGGRKYLPLELEACDICGQRWHLRRFYLQHPTKSATGTYGTKQAGVIDLCERCWLGLRGRHRRQT